MEAANLPPPQNIGNFLPDCTASCPQTQQSSYSQPWETQNVVSLWLKWIIIIVEIVVLHFVCIFWTGASKGVELLAALKHWYRHILPSVFSVCWHKQVSPEEQCSGARSGDLSGHSALSLLSECLGQELARNSRKSVGGGGASLLLDQGHVAQCWSSKCRPAIVTCDSPWFSSVTPR
jgi:uncharacterized membrane protein YgcG